MKKHPFTTIEKVIFLAIAVVVAMLFIPGCSPGQSRADTIQAEQQEALIKEATAQTGMPAIVNFRERKLLKMIYEMRDQEGLVTFTYTVGADGSLSLLCNSIGYAISDATGYTNPDRVVRDNSQVFGTMTQAEPNGLYTPDFSGDKWVMCVDPKSKRALPVLASGNTVVSPFEL